MINGDSLEGEGNNALLDYIKEAEGKSSKTCLDIGRSLFVVNKADTLDADARKLLQTETVRNKADEGFSIKLGDKKLLFTSAKYANAAKAYINNVCDKDKGDKYRVERGAENPIAADDSPEGYCYRQDRVATSERATEKQIERSDKEASAALSAGDNARLLWAASGLFALEEEIKDYGQKFASAVKAFSIIDSVNKALLGIEKSTNSLLTSGNQQLAEIERDKKELETTISAAIQEKSDEIDKTMLDDVARKELGLDSDAVSKTTAAAAETLKKKMSGGFLALDLTSGYMPRTINRLKLSVKLIGYLETFPLSLRRIGTSGLRKRRWTLSRR